MGRQRHVTAALDVGPFKTRTRQRGGEKNVEFASVATAFAKYDFPVPGGPKRRIPLHGFLLPVNN